MPFVWRYILNSSVNYTIVGHTHKVGNTTSDKALKDKYVTLDCQSRIFREVKIGNLLHLGNRDIIWSSIFFSADTFEFRKRIVLRISSTGSVQMSLEF